MRLEASDLARAIVQVQNSLEFAQSSLAEDPRLYEQFRSAGIQGFEFTYEISIKLLRRALEAFHSESTVEAMSYNELIRAGVEAQLIREASPWFRFRELRNRTSHTYNSVTADQVFSVIPAFLNEIEHFHAKVAARNA